MLSLLKHVSSSLVGVNPSSTRLAPQAPLHLQGLCCTIPPGGTLPTARRPACTTLSQTCVPSTWRLARAARRHTSRAMLLVYGT